MFGNILRRQSHGVIAGYGVAPGRPKLSHRPLPAVGNVGERCQVQGNDMPAGRNLVWCVGRGGGKMMNGQGEDVQRATQMVDTMSVIWRGTHSKINDGALVAHAWDGARDRMEPVNINSDRAYPTGLRH